MLMQTLITILRSVPPFVYTKSISYENVNYLFNFLNICTIIEIEGTSIIDSRNKSSSSKNNFWEVML
ncbi:hypothetical protein SAMN03159341_11429 [Paenibacillus sp. 1_12]|nr:hypothetical protein SAMN03159341_11429 [Paenibacillus sp. 1_12]